MRFPTAVAFVVLSAADASAAPSAAGRWQGVVQIPGLPLHATVDLDRDKSGAWIGSIVVPELSIKNVALIDITPNDNALTFAIKGALAGPDEPPAKFEARFDNDDALSGTFTQAGNHAPFTLRRIGAAQVDLPARSTPVAKEMEGKWVGDHELMGYTRHVTVTFANHGTDPATAEFVVVGHEQDLCTRAIEGDALVIATAGEQRRRRAGGHRSNERAVLRRVARNDRVREHLRAIVESEGEHVAHLFFGARREVAQHERRSKLTAITTTAAATPATAAATTGRGSRGASTR